MKGQNKNKHLYTIIFSLISCITDYYQKFSILLLALCTSSTEKALSMSSWFFSL